MDRRRFLVASAALFAAGCGGASSPVEPVLPARAPDVPFVPTRQEVVEEMLRMAGVTSKDVVYDLGCGDGRIVITAAQKFGARGVGVDIDPNRIAEARQNARLAKVEDRVTFRVENLFETDVSRATVVTLYLLPEVNMALRPRLQSQLAPGARIVSHDFDMGPEWRPEKHQRLGNDWIYLWTVPAR
jgi:ribosomal protein L11 methylase PrmA